MSNPSGSDGDAQPDADGGEPTEVIGSSEPTEAIGASEPTEVFPAAAPPADVSAEVTPPTPERRFTAPSGFDAGKTQIIESVPEPATEIFNVPGAGPAAGPGPIAPQVIPSRGEQPKPPRNRRSWGWVVAVILVIAAIAAVAILGTVLLTRNKEPVVSQEDLVRNTIQNFDTAIQKGDLATLRSITCGETADGYIRFDDKQWAEVHSRVAAARQYPVVASIDQVVVNDKHAEANVTTFMAFDPSVRSSRSFDLEFRDEQWKICQAPQ